MEATKKRLLTALTVAALALGATACDTGEQPTTLHQQAKKVRHCARVTPDNASMADCLAK